MSRLGECSRTIHTHANPEKRYLNSSNITSPARIQTRDPAAGRQILCPRDYSGLAIQKYKSEVYKYISSKGFACQPSKKLLSLVVQCSLKSEKTKDSNNYCAACSTTNQNQWKLQLVPQKKVSKKIKLKKFTGKKVNKIVLTCRICKKKQNHVCSKPSVS